MWFPHVAAHEPHQRSLEFSYLTRKRLLQQYLPEADINHFWTLRWRGRDNRQGKCYAECFIVLRFYEQLDCRGPLDRRVGPAFSPLGSDPHRALQPGGRNASNHPNRASETARSSRLGSLFNQFMFQSGLMARLKVEMRPVKRKSL